MALSWGVNLTCDGVDKQIPPKNPMAMQTLKKWRHAQSLAFPFEENRMSILAIGLLLFALA